MRRNNGETSQSICIGLSFCGEGTSDFGSEGDPDGPLQVLLLRTLNEVADTEVVFTPRTVCMHGKYANRYRDKEPNKSIGSRMRVSISRQRAKDLGKRPDLREMACAFACDLPERCLGFFHSDVDFTHSTGRKDLQDLWMKIYDSIKKGIHLANRWDRCRPVVPMPRTEAWLLHLSDPSLTPSRMENMKGNDKARKENNPKILLKEQWGEGKAAYTDKADSSYSYGRLMELDSFR